MMNSDTLSDGFRHANAPASMPVPINERRSPIPGVYDERRRRHIPNGVVTPSTPPAKRKGPTIH